MKIRSLVTVLFFLSGTTFSQTVPEKLDAYLQAAAAAGTFNGSVYLSQHGQPLIHKGVGLKDAENKTLNDTSTIFQLGSITKQFTSAIILMLAEENKLKLSDKISLYFPDFPHGDNITIEQLLSHTSGIYNYTRMKEVMDQADKPSDEARMIALFKDKELDFEPGTKYSYSNSGYSLLGYIIQKVTGKPYEQVVKERILRPLQMTHSGFDFTHLKSPDKATGYYQMGGDDRKKAKIVDSSVSFSAGSLYSTTGDLYKWNQAVLHGRLLKKASWDNAFTSRLSNYGLGVGFDSISGKRRIQHAGGIDGFVTFNVIIPADELALTVLSNNGNVSPGRIANDLLAIVYNLPYTTPTVRQEIQIDTVILRQYVGDYDFNPNFQVKVTLENGVLRAQATGQPAFRLFAEKENKFFLKAVDAQAEFTRSADGKVDKMIIYQNGNTITGAKR